MTLLAIPACTVASAEDATSSDQAVAETKVTTATKAFAGQFAVEIHGYRVKVDFKVTDIDWSALTARWDAKIVDRGGHPSVWDDVGVPMEIRLARCPGCFAFAATEPNDGSELVRVDFSDGKLSQLAYVGVTAREAKLKSAGSAPGGAAPSSGSSCALVCEGQMLDCIDGPESACTADRFSMRPRCPYDVTFEARSCADRTGGAPATGSCSLVCGGSALDCKEGVKEADCNASSFSAVPRCPHSFEFVAGGRCAN